MAMTMQVARVSLHEAVRSRVKTEEKTFKTKMLKIFQIVSEPSNHFSLSKITSAEMRFGGGISVQ